MPPINVQVTSTLQLGNLRLVRATTSFEFKLLVDEEACLHYLFPQSTNC